MNKICKANIIHAGVKMLKYLEQKKIPLDLDEFNNTNGMVFDEQEKIFRESIVVQLSRHKFNLFIMNRYM